LREWWNFNMQKDQMKFITVKNYLAQNNSYLLFLDNSFSHIKNLDQTIELNNDFFILCNNFSKNTELEFYITLNDFFNDNQPFPYDETDIRIPIKVLLSMATGAIPLMNSIGNIPISFFIIHSAIDYGVSLDIPHHTQYHNIQNTLIWLFEIQKMVPDKIENYFCIFLTYMILYAKKHSTDFHLVNDLIYNIRQVPSLLESISTEYFYHFLCQVLDWCYDNKHNDFETFFYILDNLRKSANDETTDIAIELCLYRYRSLFDKNYDYKVLEVFYDKNKEKIRFIDKLRILTELFLKLDQNKYLNLFSDEIAQLDTNYLIGLIEDTNPNVFSAYLINLAFYKNEDFQHFLNSRYSCPIDVLNTIAIYIHSNDATYILEKSINKLGIYDTDLHFNIIQRINKIFNLGITVFGESVEQILDDKYEPHRENKPEEKHTKIEIAFIESIENYYFINEYRLDDSIKYILPMQQIRVPLQQLLLKKYNKLFPIIKIVNKEVIPEKKLEKVIHIVLSESGTLDQEKEAIEYLNTLTDNIEFEYKYIDNFEELLCILKSDIYTVISITTHGEVDTRNPLNNVIKVGNEQIPWYLFEPHTYNLNNQRLLYLNICDSGHFSLKNGFILESFSTYLTNSNQATVSHMWPVNQNYSSTFLMTFLHHLISISSFKEAYTSTLSLAIDDRFDSYIRDNNLEDIELFKIFQNTSLNKKSVAHWGSLLYQE
jgi:hypothetical protein